LERNLNRNGIHWKGCNIREGTEYCAEYFLYWTPLSIPIDLHYFLLFFLELNQLNHYYHFQYHHPHLSIPYFQYSMQNFLWSDQSISKCLEYWQAPTFGHIYTNYSRSFSFKEVQYCMLHWLNSPLAPPFLSIESFEICICIHDYVVLIFWEKRYLEISATGWCWWSQWEKDFRFSH